MTPEDVLLEAIAAASLHGDSAELRAKMCSKLIRVMVRYYEAVPYYPSRFEESAS